MMMRRYLPLMLLLAAAFVAESRITVYGVALNLTVLFAYSAGLRHGPVRGALTGATVGALADSVSGGMLGPLMLSKSTVGFLASYLRGGLFVWSRPLGMVAVMLLTTLDGLIALAMASIFQQDAIGMTNIWKVLFWQALLNAWAGLLMRPEDEEL